MQRCLLRTSYRLAVLGLAVLPLGACASRAATHSSPPDSPPPDAVAVYRDGVVRAGDYEDWLRYRGIEDDSARRRSEIEQLLLGRQLVAAAEAEGIADEPAIQHATERLATTLLVKALKQRTLQAVEVDAEEVEAYYRAHPRAFHRPRKVRLRNLFKRVPADAPAARWAAARSRLESLRQEIQAGADFAALAQEESDSQTRFQGGLIGNVAAGQLRPDVDAVVMGLKAGEVSDIVALEDGLAIFYCETIIEAVTPTPEAVKEKMAANLLLQTRRTAWENLEASLLREANPRYDLQAPPGEPVARLADGVVTREALAEALRGAGKEPEALPPAKLQMELERFVLDRLLAQHARQLGLADDPQLALALRWQRREILATEAMRRRVAARFSPLAEEAVRAYYEAHRERYRRRARFQLQVIEIPLTAGQERQRYHAAETLRARLQKDEITFEEAARRHSGHPSATSGGDLGWISRPRLATFGPHVWRTVVAMSPGELSPLIQQDESLWLFKLHGIEDERLQTFEEARAAAEQALGNERAQALQAKITAEIIADLELRLLSS